MKKSGGINYEDIKWIFLNFPPILNRQPIEYTFFVAYFVISYLHSCFTIFYWCYIITLIGPVYLIQFKFRQLEIPPNYNVNHLGKCNSIVMLKWLAISFAKMSIHSIFVFLHGAMSCKSSKTTTISFLLWIYFIKIDSCQTNQPLIVSSRSESKWRPNDLIKTF